eukprot:Blabericola_migrator_1__12523@NODE_793_length_6483_cov_21_480206_g331_i4_p6_GENE_NODE_793_length_6483_cov_21_480206_g331_i4NODE_793_length_6483_cov_21_480206_g331_i4_p6_ORF_typecomplete_len107_score10_86SHMT/PF00464_19/0_19_NODE_793_length_6483_cov_21_480206_g331_i411521472
MKDVVNIAFQEPTYNGGSRFRSRLKMCKYGSMCTLGLNRLSRLCQKRTLAVLKAGGVLANPMSLFSMRDLQLYGLLRPGVLTLRLTLQNGKRADCCFVKVVVSITL